MGDAAKQPLSVLGRYALFDEIASGGMATVHLGRLLGTSGFSRTVAIKRLHPHIAKDSEFREQFLDEARMAARISHPNVVQTLDVLALDGELFLVMEYVHGESLAQLLRSTRANRQHIPYRIVAHIMADALHGLHAAHEAKSDLGEPLGLVHRDMSPQNVLVGIDGSARVLDFGVAKAAGRVQTTQGGQIKGKLAYMSPEQVSGEVLTRQTDVFAAAIVLWEALTTRRLFAGNGEADILLRVLSAEPPPPPSSIVAGLPPSLDQVVARGLEREASKRFTTAHEMAVALEEAAGLIPRREVAEWLQAIAGEALTLRAELLAEIESTSAHIQPAPSVRPASVSGDFSPSLSTDSSSVMASEIGERRAQPARPRRWVLGIALTAVVAVALVVAFAAKRAPSPPPTASQAADAPLAGAAAKAGSAAIPAPSTEHSAAVLPEPSAAEDPPPASTASANAAPSPQKPPARAQPRETSGAPAKPAPKPTSIYSRY
jgi:eukaryotic-like serine/threonine-protein kinase